MLVVCYLAAVETFERYSFARDDVKFGCHWFCICDALWVDALADALDSGGEFHGAFFLDLVVADDVEIGGRGDERNLIDFAVLEKLVGDLDNRLFAKLVRIQIVAECYGRVDAVETKNANYLKKVFGGDVVYHRAVLYRAYFQFFLFHFCLNINLFVVIRLAADSFSIQKLKEWKRI